jgi:hypothetical protein
MRPFQIPHLAALALLAGCANQTLYRSNFDTSDVGAAPTGTQFRGTLAVIGPAGGAQVINPPDGASGNWLQAAGPNSPADSGIEGRLIGQPAPGIFHVAGVVDMPAGAATGTLALNAAPAGASFLTLQFLPNNRVQLNGDPATQFGGFARNTPFQVLITLNTESASSTAHIALIGAGASGTADTVIANPALAQHFAAVAILSAGGTPTAIAATNIAVTRPASLNTPPDHPVALSMRE